MNLNKPFTMEEALAFQNLDLKRWRTVLLPDVYRKLEGHALHQNKTVTDPYTVFRGKDVDNWVSEYMYAHCPCL